jgi:signal transduction histidine kinase
MNPVDLVTATILIADDTPENLRVLTRMLQDQGFKVRPALEGETALESARQAPPDLILLDIMMPGMDGFQVCQQLKQEERTGSIPVLFISALEDVLDKVKAFQVGGVDYITKPFQLEEVLARVKTHLTLDRLRRHNQELHRLKDEMLRIVSHDLKNPLAAIQSSAELLIGVPGLRQDPAQLLDSLSRIQRNAVYSTALVTDLLSLAEIEAGVRLHLQRITLLPLLKHQIANLAQLAQQKQITLQLDCPDEALTLEADPLRLEQVINNLLSNGIKYTPENGSVTLSAHSEKDQIRIQVKDTGFGIPASDLPRIFDQFYRVDRASHQSVKGTGLGLSIVQRIVHQHQGKIWVESKVGEGTVFTVQLPRDRSLGTIG